MRCSVFHDQMENAMQRNSRIGSDSILAFYCVTASANVSMTHNARQALASYYEPALRVKISKLTA